MVVLIGVAAGFGSGLWRLPSEHWCPCPFRKSSKLRRWRTRSGSRWSSSAAPFVSLEQLPGFLPVVARLLPLTYAAEALDGVLLDGSRLAMTLDVAVLVGFTAMLFMLATKILPRRLDQKVVSPF